MKASDILKKPYKRVIIPDTDTGTYTSLIDEFPGCISQGESPEQAYARLEEVARVWVEISIQMGQAIPEPTEGR